MRFTLLNNYVRSAFRNITKNKLFSIINIFGLAISMSVGLLIITFVSELNSYDKFQQKGDRIYRITNKYQYLDEDANMFASTSVIAGKRVQSEIAGIERTSIIYRNFGSDFGTQERKLPLEGFYASEDFFNIFSFHLIEGDALTALKEPYSVAITQKAADKLFGNEARQVVGRVLAAADDKEYTITALVKNPPFNSHLQFEIIGSFSTKDHESIDDKRWLTWTNMWMNHVYILVEEGVNPADIQLALNKISDEENAKEEHTKINLGLQRLENITPGPDLSNQIGKTASMIIPVMLSIFAAIVILSACFNYTNLSIARSLRRAKEVGVRKVIGSNSGQIFGQFILEAIIISLLALLFALGLFFLMRPVFIGLDDEFMNQVRMELDSIIVIKFIFLALVTGFVAGLLPALLFARISPNSVLRNSVSLSKVKGIALRKVLIVIQFTLSIIFIIGAIYEYEQYRYALNFDLGYKTDNILNIELHGNKIDVLKAEFNKIPEVEQISSSMMITSVGSYWGDYLKYQDPLDSIMVYYNGIDENYLPLHQHKLLAGNNFAPVSNDTATVQIIVNEKLLNRFNIGSPEKAVGAMLKLNKKEARIVGVIRDFHYGTLTSEVEPFLFKYQTKEFYQLNVKFNQTADLLTARKKIEQAWKQIDDIHPIEATFYNNRIEEAYAEYSIMVKVIGALALLAIIIASLGLLGMVMFTTETKLKEIGIRKVLGASEASLLYLLGKSFLLLLLISSLIGIPITVLIFTEFIFAEEVYHVGINFVDTVIGPLIVLLIGLITTVIITFFAARTNPAAILRSE